MVGVFVVIKGQHPFPPSRKTANGRYYVSGGGGGGRFEQFPYQNLDSFANTIIPNVNVR